MARQHSDRAGQHQASQRRALLSLWRASTHDTKQVPSPAEGDASRTVSRPVKRPGARSLKQFARSLEGEDALKAECWLGNKRLNAAAPLKKIGKTRKRVKSGGKVQQDKKD